jgi:hypothetical protein
MVPRYPHSLALGLARLPPSALAADRREARIALALLAARHGYALAETVEVGGTGDGAVGPGTIPAPEWGPDVHDDLDAALTTVEHLVLRLDVDALAVAGDVHRERVEEFAARVRLVVLYASWSGW